MNKETLILRALLVIGVIALAVWFWVGDHGDRILGSQYVEIREEIHRFDPDVAIWDSDEERWIRADAERQRPFHIHQDSDHDDRWVYAEVDPETGEASPSAVWERVDQRWVAATYIEEDDEYVMDRDAAVEAPMPADTWHRLRGVDRDRSGEEGVQFDLSRTLGLWFAAICTLFVMSFLYRDNPYYKFTEALVVGVSAAYSMVVAFWATVVPNLIGRLSPEFVQTYISPARDTDADLWYVIVAIFGLMLLWRLAPQGGWISRWPLAFIIGVFAGIRLIAHLEADFAIQIQATILPLFVREGGQFDLLLSLQNAAIVLGLLACLTYFFFSIEHKGIVGKTARVGIYILMITFGASFAYTVMGRITLLTQRFEFILDDWLWVIG